MTSLLRRLVAATLVALVLVGAAGALGWWQLEAWQARRAAEARDLTSAEPVPLTSVMGADDPFPGGDVGRPVTVSGTWLPEGSFLVPRSDAGRDGYWAVTPLALGAADAAVLVVRGWAPTTEVPAPSGAGEVTGWLQPPEGSGTAVDEDPSDDVLPELRVADAVQRVDTDLYSAYVVADAAGTGLEPASLASLPEAGRFTALRNLLYAIEWWVFGGFAAFIWWRWVRDTRAEAAADAVTDSPA
ncbi:SURF1 family protein [Nocardioides gansuensis]|uniref:SURF1 family protein n=1 Tax=Nocardioides gansuensis TaxID=2138300 RepID=UPI001402B9CD|nr:SURF1 family protein [Nocardioides gansuensis]